jgi:hypothetical protein
VSSQGVSLSLLMNLVAVIALDLFFLRVHPFLPQSPLQLFALAMLDLVIIQYFILRRRLGSFHYTFLIVGLVASLVLHSLSFNSVHALETFIRLYQEISGGPTWKRKSLGYLAIADRCVTSTLVLLLAWAGGLWVARQVRRRQARPGRRCRRIASFFQGALIGLGVFTVILITLNYLGQEQAPRFSPGQYVGLLRLGLTICTLLGGTAVMLLGSRRDTE